MLFVDQISKQYTFKQFQHKYFVY